MNNLRFGRVANDNTANYILEKMKVIPKHLIDIVKEQGIKTYCFNESCSPSYIGLREKEIFEDGRTIDEAACFMSDKKAISLFDCDCDEELGYCTTLHEFGHALDYALGIKSGNKNYLSYADNIILKGWQKQRGLDWYANLNPQEYFAQAFMAFFQRNIPLYKSWSYRAHTKEELFLKDNDMFCILKEIGGIK